MRGRGGGGRKKMRGRVGEEKKRGGGGEERVRRRGKDGATKDFLLLGNQGLSLGAHVRRGLLPYLPARPWATKGVASGLMCTMLDSWICSLVVHRLPATRRCDSNTVCKMFRIIFPYCPLSQSRKIKKSRFVVFCVVHRFVGSAFLPNGHMGGQMCLPMADRREGCHKWGNNPGSL